ncbi:MAG: AI-2E family transporter [Neomegalonema sp.]|nr:AI-2E family transporter [Neomegalonema sp.]
MSENNRPKPRQNQAGARKGQAVRDPGAAEALSEQTGAWPRDPQTGNGAAPGLKDAFYALGLITLVVTVLTLAAEQLAPVALAVLIWFLINAIARGLEGLVIKEKRLPRWPSLALASAVTLGAMFLAGSLVVANGRELASGVSGIDVKISNALQGMAGLLGFEWEASALNLSQYFTFEAVMEQIFNAVTTTAGGISVVVLYVLFLLLDQPFYEHKLRALFPNQQGREHVNDVLAKIGEDTRTYIWLMTVVSLGVGVFTYMIAGFVGLKGAAFWGFLAFALNYIPTVGSFLGVLFPLAFALVQFDDPTVLLGLAVALGLVQFVMGNILLPRMTGDRLNLSQFVVILSLSIWGSMWGVMGLFLGVPLMMVLAIVLAQFDSTRPVAVLMSMTGTVAVRSRNGKSKGVGRGSERRAGKRNGNRGG